MITVEFINIYINIIIPSTLLHRLNKKQNNPNRMGVYKIIEEIVYKFKRNWTKIIMIFSMNIKKSKQKKLNNYNKNNLITKYNKLKLLLKRWSLLLNERIQNIKNLTHSNLIVNAMWYITKP